MNRRSFVTGLAGILAAPAIVRVGGLMPVSVPKLVVPSIAPSQWLELRNMYGDAD